MLCLRSRESFRAAYAFLHHFLQERWEAHHTLSAEFQGYPGVIHGGIIASMLDEVMGRVFMEGDPPRFMVTADFKDPLQKTGSCKYAT